MTDGIVFGLVRPGEDSAMQRASLDGLGVKRIHESADTSLIGFLQPGDGLAVESLGRLGKTVSAIAAVAAELQGREAHLIAASEKIDTRSGGDFFLALAALGAIAAKTEAKAAAAPKPDGPAPAPGPAKPKRQRRQPGEEAKTPGAKPKHPAEVRQAGIKALFRQQPLTETANKLGVKVSTLNGWWHPKSVGAKLEFEKLQAEHEAEKAAGEQAAS